jgi:ComF family protein
MSPLLRVLLEAACTFVAPPRCAACDEAVPIATAFCPACASTLVRAPDSFGPSRVSAFVYGGAIAEALRRFKFDDRPDLGRPLMAGLATHLPSVRRRGIELVVPVPLHPSRLVERGYNQAALLARPVARLLDARFAPHVLRRVASTARQTDLTREERAANVLGAFAVTGQGIERARVLVVDDVETTGATLAACTAALRSSGAADVSTLTVARALADA